MTTRIPPRAEPAEVDSSAASDLSTCSAASDFFEMSLDHLCVTGFDGMFVRVNPSWSRTLGWSTEELLSRPTISFVHPDDRAATLAGRGRLHQGSTLGPLVNRYLCKDGSYRWFEWRSHAELGRRLVYAAARDITEQKQMEESLRASREQEKQLERQLLFADRMASIGTLAAGAAHEINNPLATIAANLAMVVEELPTLRASIPAPQLDELVQMVTDASAAARTIRDVIHGLKTFARAADEHRSTIAVREVLEVAVRLTSHQIRQCARLVTDYGATPAIHADSARLGQVFVNLLVNACQAIPDGGGDSDAHEIRVTTSTDAAGRAVIEIRDTGVGIPPAALERIFDPFFTTKSIGVGTGLGLSICHNLVSSLGGTITVTSELGHGTAFCVVIPPAVPPQVHAPRPVAGAGALACVRVLVVDDEPALGRTVARLLRGHDVTVVTSAADALARLDAGATYDLILSDMMMPVMSGMELHAELMRRDPGLAARVVFITGGTFTTSATEFLDRVPNERLLKPFDLAALRNLVERYATR